MQKTFSYSSHDLENSLSDLLKDGITELFVHDDEIANDKKKLLLFLKQVEHEVPNLFVSIKINAKNLDADVLRACSKINCSIEIPFAPLLNKEKGKEVFFDKKFYSRRCSALNNEGLVFGAALDFALVSGDSIKAFFDRLNFAVFQYSNHITFEQLDYEDESLKPHVTGTFSAKDLRYAREIAFACRTFYSAGRAVPWFNSILGALKITPSAFFSDFAEWQRVNNCDFASGFVPEDVNHHEIEKMQLLFLQQKFEEKRKNYLFAAVNDIVCLNGALSRLVSDGTESILETEYNPDEIFSPEAMDISSFVTNVCMENCTVKVFINNDGEPDYKIL